MDENRFARLEIRVDEIKDDVSELKADSKLQRESLKDIKDDIKQYTVEVKSHVAGDEKIISELVPLFDSLKHVLPEIIEKHEYEKKKKQESDAKIKYWASRLGLVSLSIAIISWVLKTFV